MSISNIQKGTKVRYNKHKGQIIKLKGYKMDCGFNLKELPNLLDFDYGHIEKSRERQCRAWRFEKNDWPLIFVGAPLNERQKAIPEFNCGDTFFDKSKMLCSQVRMACCASNGRSDTVPSIRANLGTGILLACLGLEQEAFPDKMPWLKEHMGKEEISRISPDDIKIRGSFERGLDMMRHFREILGDKVPIYVMDTQGPFDLAHLLLGDQLFLEMYDDPPFVHHLMEICLALGIKTHKWMKEAACESISLMHHSNALFSDSFGIRICEDTTALLGEEQIREFAIPYSVRLAREFGNAWVHYCGCNDALTDAILEAPEFKVLNFGHIPGHEHEIDFYKNIEKFERQRKVNWNWWPKMPNENEGEYLRRLHHYAGKGVLAPCISPSETGFNSASELLKCWKDLGGV